MRNRKSPIASNIPVRFNVDASADLRTIGIVAQSVNSLVNTRRRNSTYSGGSCSSATSSCCWHTEIPHVQIKSFGTSNWDLRTFLTMDAWLLHQAGLTSLD